MRAQRRRDAELLEALARIEELLKLQLKAQALIMSRASGWLGTNGRRHVNDEMLVRAVDELADVDVPSLRSVNK
ncbi:MAG: hypothetical protein KA758_06965 [Acidimicrobiales bacterium]|jgi:hypothetical protein|nr:hypothetical protein [Acidimicrobiales bacterium]